MGRLSKVRAVQVDKDDARWESERLDRDKRSGYVDWIGYKLRGGRQLLQEAKSMKRKGAVEREDQLGRGCGSNRLQDKRHT